MTKAIKVFLHRHAADFSSSADCQTTFLMMGKGEGNVKEIWRERMVTWRIKGHYEFH